MIEARGLTKRFKDVVAMDHVSFRADDGRVTGLVGPNGAGKSTTLRVLCTVIRADSGRARVDGFNVADEPLAVRRQIGALPHLSGLYPNLTGRENIAYYAAMQGLRRREAKRAVDTVIERLGIGDLSDRRAKGFSHGEGIRVALARSMVHRPQTVILDEPTNGLDVVAARALRDVIRDLRREGRCVLFSSHVMQEVAMLCDDLVIISRGRVAISGTPEEIRRRTGSEDLEDAFVAAIGPDEEPV
ncbi:MAG: ATP-binding cassette domain-containing protein [Gammaproteobacteria bacterium]|nr:ATP-binding cassette domain-containing protein [Gammaproteobacteria bacterium]